MSPLSRSLYFGEVLGTVVTEKLLCSLRAQRERGVLFPVRRRSVDSRRGLRAVVSDLVLFRHSTP